MSGGREAGTSGDGPAGERGGGVAVFDPFAGIAGDMVLGAWADLGLDVAACLRDVAAALELPEPDVRVERVRRAGIVAASVALTFPDAADGGRGEDAGRRWRDIRGRIEGARLSERGKALSLGAFERLARAEGRVHGVPAEDVHFHEVGALDAMLDVCGAAEGLARLDVVSATTRAVAVGQGTVRIEHGRYPLPAPATAYLLEGTTTVSPGYEGECVTPTGAALLATFTEGRAFSGDLAVRRVGYGAGSRDPDDRPNCLRVWLGEPAGRGEALVALQSDLDDLSPEYVPDLVEACLEAGAVDAVVRGVQMKKGRPGWRVEALVRPQDRPAVEEALLRRSTTLGVRSWRVGRRVLPRRVEAREWRGHEIRVKVVRRPGAADGEATAKPEHDDVAAAAAAEGMAAVEVMRELRRTWPDLA